MALARLCLVAALSGALALWTFSNADAAATDDLAVRGFEHDRDVLALGELLADLERSSRPLSDRADRPDDVRLRQCASAVFAASDRRRMFTVEANRRDPAIAAAGANLDQNELAFLVTLTAAAVTLSRLARSIADAPPNDASQPCLRGVDEICGV